MDVSVYTHLPHSSNALSAELRGSDEARALGITARSATPVLLLCRKLLVAGHDASTPLEAYREQTLCLRVASIGAGARLEINGAGNGFRRLRQPDAGPPMRLNGRGAS